MRGIGVPKGATLINKNLNFMDIDIPEWIISLNQDGRKIEVICENDRRYIFEI